MQSTLKNRTVFCKDNLEVLRGINSETVDLIYLDPPFNKKKVFTATIGSSAEGASFQDIFREEDVKEEWLGLIAEKYPAMYNYLQGTNNIGHKSNKNYLCYMAVRLIEMRRILKDTGSLYLHCDPTMSHYLKLLMDCIFGEKNFKNEIVWCYGGRGLAKKHFNRKHDVIFLYGLTNSTHFYAEAASRPVLSEHTMRYNKIDSQGHQYARVKNKDGSYSNIYLKDVVREDWWTIPYVRGAEYVGYPTQKPLALLERIIKASSKENDFVLDPFCGCATTCIAAEQLNRKWVGIDVSKKAFEILKVRLRKEVASPDDLFKYDKKIIYRRDSPQRTDQNEEEKLRRKKDKKQYLYGLQKGICKGCSIHFQYQNLTIEHLVPRSKGGGDHVENLCLLCAYCNSTKGDRDMAYLKSRLKELKII